MLPPSHCPRCDTHLAPADLVPIVSWVLLGGKCRYCEAPISKRYPFVEAITGCCSPSSVGGSARLGPLPPTSSSSASSWRSRAIDIDTTTLPRRLVYACSGAGAVLFAARLGDRARVARLRWAAIGAAAVYVVFRSIHAVARGGFGYGDVRLGAMLGGYLGWLGLAYVPIGIFAASCWARSSAWPSWSASGADRRTALPFGPFLAAGRPDDHRGRPIVRRRPVALLRRTSDDHAHVDRLDPGSIPPARLGPRGVGPPPDRRLPAGGARRRHAGADRGRAQAAPARRGPDDPFAVHRGPLAGLPAEQAARLLVQLAGHRPFPRQRLSAARRTGARPARHPLLDPHARGAQRPGGGPQPPQPALRPGAVRGSDRFRQVDDARRHDRPDQREPGVSHPHDRGPDRVPAPPQAVAGEPARGRRGHTELRRRPARRPSAKTPTSSWSARCETSSRSPSP